MHEQSINYYPTYVKNNSCIVHQMTAKQNEYYF